MKRLYWPIVGYIAVLFSVFGSALLPGPTEMIWGDDVHRQYYFYRQFFVSFLNEGVWPWWNPYLFGGTPFIANPIVNIWYPPTWLFVVFPLTIAYSWHLALHLLWAMVGMYTLLRRVISNYPIIPASPAGRQLSNEKQRRITYHVSRIAQFDLGPWLAGLVFGLSGFFTARIWAGHVDVIAAASWMPWVVAAFWKLIQEDPTKLRHGVILSVGARRPVVVAAVVFALQLLAGYQTMALFTLEAVFILALFHSFLAKSLRPIFLTGLAGLTGLALAAIQILPVQEFFRQSIRTFDVPYSWNSYGSLTLESLKQFISPFVFGDQTTYHGPPPNYAEHAFFVGRIGLLVALLGSVIALRKFSVWFWFFSLTAFFGLWVSLGPHGPIDLQYILWKLVPMYQYLRIPPRHLILVVFGLSGMVGMTLKSSNILTRVFALFITLEMVLYARHFIALKPIPESRHDAELIELLSPPRCRASFTSGVVDQDCLYRVLPNFGAWIPPRDSFDFDAAMEYRVFNATGYDPSILRSYYEYIDRANGNEPGASILNHDVQVPYLNVFSPATDFLNVKYILVPRAYDPLYGVKTDRFVLLREDIQRDYRFYENKTVKPRFYFEQGAATVTRYTPNEIVIVTDTDRQDWLMSSEVFYPGWEGFVDGKKVDVIRINHAFRALFVPAGRHTVTYRYSPRIFLLGGLISAVTAGLCFMIWTKHHELQPEARKFEACVDEPASGKKLRPAVGSRVMADRYFAKDSACGLSFLH